MPVAMHPRPEIVTESSAFSAPPKPRDAVSALSPPKMEPPVMVQETAVPAGTVIRAVAVPNLQAVRATFTWTGGAQGSEIVSAKAEGVTVRTTAIASDA